MPGGGRRQRRGGDRQGHLPRQRTQAVVLGQPDHRARLSGAPADGRQPHGAPPLSALSAAPVSLAPCPRRTAERPGRCTAAPSAVTKSPSGSDSARNAGLGAPSTRQPRPSPPWPGSPLVLRPPRPARSPRWTWRPLERCPPGSPNWTECWAAESFPARWCCWPASPEWGSQHCCWKSPTAGRPATPPALRSTSPARNPPDRSGCAPSAPIRCTRSCTWARKAISVPCSGTWTRSNPDC